MSGSDTVLGGSGDDVLDGGDEPDGIWNVIVDDYGWYAYGGGDRLDGGEGDDTLDGGRGDDTLTGGAGHDTFVFGPGPGREVITDFGAEDSLVVRTAAGAVLSNEELAWRVYYVEAYYWTNPDDRGLFIATDGGRILFEGISEGYLRELLLA